LKNNSPAFTTQKKDEISVKNENSFGAGKKLSTISSEDVNPLN
jgi:hypothetical protein